MYTLVTILAWALVGLLAGVAARLLLPANQSMGLVATSLLGVLGSLTGGFMTWIFVGGEPLQTSGFVMSILGAVMILSLVLWGASPQSRRS